MSISFLLRISLDQSIDLLCTQQNRGFKVRPLQKNVITWHKRSSSYYVDSHNFQCSHYLAYLLVNFKIHALGDIYRSMNGPEGADVCICPPQPSYS